MQVVSQIYCLNCGAASFLDDDGEFYRCSNCGRLTMLKEADMPLGTD